LTAVGIGKHRVNDAEVLMPVVGAVVVAALLTGGLAWLLGRPTAHADPTGPRVDTGTIQEAVHRWPRLRRLLRRHLDPGRTTDVALTGTLIVVTATSLGVGVLLVMIRTRSGVATWDRSAAQWGARHATATSTGVLKVLTQFGGSMVVVVAGVVVAVAETVRTRRRAVLGFLVAVFVGVTVIVNLTKWLVDRTRPDIDRLVGFSGPSFPSGHAATSAAVYAAIALVLGRRRSYRTRRALAAAAVGLAGAVATTRVLLGVHWVTDVIAGLLVGWAWFAVCSIAFGGRRLRFGEPVEAATRAAEASAQPAARR
jgi:membrane-associated phospholipid phosphatase